MAYRTHPDLSPHTPKVCDENHRFGLAIAFINRQSCCGFPRGDYFRIHRLARAHTVTQFREAVSRQILPHHQPQRRRRRAPCCNWILRERSQCSRSIELAPCVHRKHTRAHVPRPEETRPRRLAPARVREIPVNVVRLQIQPQLTGEPMR